MYHRHAAGLAHLGVGVYVVGGSVGGPAGVAHSHQSGDVLPLPGQVPQYLETALGLHYLQALFCIIHRQARRVIAPVLQPGQPIQQNRGCLFLADKTNDSTHIDCSS